jgi:hypothetical protein
MVHIKSRDHQELIAYTVRMEAWLTLQNVYLPKQDLNHVLTEKMLLQALGTRKTFADKNEAADCVNISSIPLALLP